MAAILNSTYRRSVASFEDFLDSKVSFFVYRGLLSALQGKARARERLFRKVHETGYRFYFRKPDLAKAYRIRVDQAIAMERGEKGGDAAKASDYLDVVYGDGSSEWLGSNHPAIAHLFGRTPRRGLFAEDAEGGERVGSILVCGPSADLGKIDFAPHDLVAFNKPIDLGRIGLAAGKTLVILNNQWSIGKRPQVIEWAARNPGVRIIAPNPMGVPGETSEPLEGIPRFPFGASLMGLQRALWCLLRQYRPAAIRLEGFDFSLSQVPYNEWYPSLLKAHHGTFDKGFIFTNMAHDFLLNYSYVKKMILSHGNLITGSVIPFTSARDAEVLGLLEGKLRSAKKRNA